MITKVKYQNYRKNWKKSFHKFRGSDRPYLKNNIETFVSQVRNKLNLSENCKSVVELHMISERSAEDIDAHLSKLLKSKGIAPENNLILIDESYHGSFSSLLQIFYDSRACWMAGVLSGQNPLNIGSIPYAGIERFQVRPLRRLYRGNKGITMASSPLKLARLSDFPSFLANQFSYIECFNNLKVQDIDQFPGLGNDKNTLAA